MYANLQRIQVNGLFGTDRRIDAHIVDNTLILVGENGSGKSTFLRIIFNVLAGRWISLSLIRFESIILTIDDIDRIINSSDLPSHSAFITNNFLRGQSPSVRRMFMEQVTSGDTIKNPRALERMTEKYGVSFNSIMKQLQLFDDELAGLESVAIETLKTISESLQSQVLYLPTYRRIERELTSVVDWLDPDDLRRQRKKETVSDRDHAYIELVEFGMQDVEESIRAEQDRLQQFQSESLRVLTLTHFGDIVSKAYKEEDVDRLGNLSNDAVTSVLSRVDDSIVDGEQRMQWHSTIQAARSKERPHSEREQIICHYFLKLFDFQNDLQSHEKRIATFCNICSEYIRDKEFVYDSTKFSFSIRPTFEIHGEDSIQLSDLSSGEKQVVSLFSHLYLSGQSSYFVLIDEPELSLSVPWQKRFLVDIKDGGFCAGLIAVTHSPFIYDNELRVYAHGLGEFSKV